LGITLKANFKPPHNPLQSGHSEPFCKKAFVKTKPPSSTIPPSTQPLPIAAENRPAAFPIVGIGASAGGLEAFEQFFLHTSADCGMAFVLVPHLDPSHASLLTEILQRTTHMPVVEAQDQTAVAANCVYIIPPNRNMEIFHGKLQLSIPNEPRGLRMPIDTFLRSLAEDQQANAIGIILSGTGTDGTLGLRNIMGAGGITLVQEPNTAQYSGMPASAIQAGYATQVLLVEKMPEALLAYARKILYVVNAPAPLAVNGMNRILMQLRTLTGHDFSLYKKSTIGRRIERRMSQHNIDNTEVYARYLKENPAEVQVLFKELLINVTSFFRDAEAFAALQQEILPQLCQGKPDGYVFRVWVAGCATGEEAYSIAILLREWMTQAHQEFKVQIYSTDLDDDAIAIARAGIYPPNIAQDLTPERLQRFFVKEDAGYRIKKEIREMVVFAVQNVIKDPPFTKLDLLSCRNLMIYLEPELQNRLISTFHYALKPDGVLLLSPSESIGSHIDLFSTLNRKWKIYRANHALNSAHTMMAHGLSWAESGGKAPEETMTKLKETNFAELTRKVLVQYFAPASLITDRKGTILYVYGETGKYLRPAPGQPSLNAIEMAREGLELALRTAISTAVNEALPTLSREMQVKTNGGYTAVALSVRPLSGQDAKDLLLISFQDIANPAVKSRRKRVSKPDELGRIEELERDLAYQKESHQVTLEEQQASNEELKSINEEMQSTNEELQSTNEELETSKEELQSINEELITVNSELQTKIEQLANMQNDMKNLLDNINVGIIFLDRHLQIRSYTREAVRIYRLVPSDVGRPLNDIKSVLERDDHLLAAAKEVLKSLMPYELELHLSDDTWILARIQSYRTLDNMIDGAVMTFTDITARIKALATETAHRLAQGIIDTLQESLVVLDASLKVVSASRSFYQTFKVTPEETVGREIYALGNQQWDIPDLRNLLETILLRSECLEKIVVAQNFPGIGYCKMLLNARRILGKTGEPTLILLSMEMINDR
jgi:two-component system, chemotaxis family, CheB/CheR fusion protein